MVDEPDTRPVSRDRVVVVTDPETADGFRLSGARVRVCSTARQGALEVTRLLREGSVKAILANEDFLEELDEETRRYADDSAIPVIELPLKDARVTFPAHEEALRAITRLKGLL